MGWWGGGWDGVEVRLENEDVQCGGGYMACLKAWRWCIYHDCESCCNVCTPLSQSSQTVLLNSRPSPGLVALLQPSVALQALYCSLTQFSCATGTRQVTNTRQEGTAGTHMHSQA